MTPDDAEGPGVRDRGRPTALRSLRGPPTVSSLSFLPAQLGRAVVLAVIGSGLVVVSSPEAAHAAATATVGSTRLGVGAYAGGNNQGVSQQSLDHDGNKSLTGTDSDSGPNGSASATATLSSTASATKITATGSASTSQSEQASVSLSPASVALTTTLGESGQWVWAGSFDVTASGTTPDGCIAGSVSVYVTLPGKTDPDYVSTASVSSCTNGSAHKTFGSLAGVGVALEAGARIRTSGLFTSPSSFASGTSDASFSVEVRKVASPVSNTGLPHLAGSGVVGSTLTTSTGTWNGSPDTFSYQWRSGGADVPGATASTYVVRPGDVGKAIQCYVTATNGSSTSSQYSNSVVGREAPPPAPVALSNTGLPTVSGKFVVGRKLTATAGEWSHSPSTVGYQWLRNGKPIGGATGAGYKLVGKDKGKKISVQVTVGAPNHLDGTATSKATKVKPRPKR